MSEGKPGLEDIHVTIFAYQKEYLEDQGYNASKVIRQEIDDKIRQDGGDPESLRSSYGE